MFQIEKPFKNYFYGRCHDGVVQNIVSENYTVAIISFVFLMNNGLEFPLLTDMCKLDFGAAGDLLPRLRTQCLERPMVVVVVVETVALSESLWK